MATFKEIVQIRMMRSRTPKSASRWGVLGDKTRDQSSH